MWDRNYVENADWTMFSDPDLSFCEKWKLGVTSVELLFDLLIGQFFRTEKMFVYVEADSLENRHKDCCKPPGQKFGLLFEKHRRGSTRGE